MNKRLLGPISVCLTAASLSLARGEPPARFPLGATLPATAEPTGQPAQSFQKPATSQIPRTDTGAPPPNQLTPITNGTTSNETMTPNNGTVAVPGGTVGTAGGMAPPKVDLKDDHIGPIDRAWFKAEYLYWWTRNGPLGAPLLTAGGNPGTVVLGNSDLDYGGRSGGRLTAGFWLDDLHQFGVEVSGFALDRPTVSQAVNSDGNSNPVLARPFLAASIPEALGAAPGMPGTPASLTIAAPGILNGGLSISSASRLWGAEANFVRNLFDDLHLSGSLLFGIRYLSLEEDLQINQFSNMIGNGNFDGFPSSVLGFASPGTVADSFRTQNYFYGGQIGGRLGWRSGIWAVDVETKVALGTNHEAVNILGSTTPAGAAQSMSGGFLALATNSGHQAANWFVVVPEVGVQVGCQLSRHWRAHVGYDFLYINSVVRPGNQVNTTVNPGYLPPVPLFPAGPREPAPLFRQSDFWAHGITAGVTLTF